MSGEGVCRKPSPSRLKDRRLSLWSGAGKGGALGGSGGRATRVPEP